MKRAKLFVIAGLVIAAVIIMVLVNYLTIGDYPSFPKRSTPTPSTPISHGRCLEEDEFVDYPINPKYAPEVKAPLNPLVVSVRDKISGEQKFSFTIDGIDSNHYHPLELHKCSIYIIREFNYDPTTRRSTPSYRNELWAYNYDSYGRRVLLFSQADESGKYKSFFDDDFRIDHNERYVVLTQSYLGKDDYALVIKDLNTLENVLVWRLKDIIDANPDILPGSFNLGVFTPDGQYLWGTLYDGPFDTVYYRIETGSWNVELLRRPPDLPSGAERDLNFAGWVAYVDMTSFTGLQEITEQIEQEAREQGKQKNLWLYNLFTKQRIKVASADPSHRFKPKFLSDTELEYTLPSGEKKIYTIF